VIQFQDTRQSFDTRSLIVFEIITASFSRTSQNRVDVSKSLEYAYCVIIPV